ncbi:hypothetical protein J4218_02035 [Candidatus Pacearchaeota archaeon]|nr:hypothetical protein [uncultured archaeon]AQS29131.1 hypothetical protein [uncultured archaeon]AQS29715.1 hypothetical protein [uncultured archaeon]MBS3078877.1 hypothetical protein [Candidatus Pacearchaeota archaeon]
MKAYYFISPIGSEFLYIDSILLSYRHITEDNPHHKFSPELLRKFKLAERNGKFNKYSLEKRDWDFEELDISDKVVGDFINACFKRRSKRRLNSHASRIFNWAFSHSNLAVESGLRDEDDTMDTGNREVLHEGGYKEILPLEEVEDKSDNWWAEGQEPPY